MALTNETIRTRLTEKFGDVLTEWAEPYNMLTFTAPAELNLKVMQFLFDDPQMKFIFLTSLCGVHYPDRTNEEIGVVYHMHNLEDNVRLRFKVFVPVTKPDVFSATALFQAANFLERETYDYYGVNFLGHPNLIRILNVDEMDYFPMRKEFPLEDQSRIDKDDAMFGRSNTLSEGARLQNSDQTNN